MLRLEPQSVVATAPELCNPRAPAVQAPPASCLPEDLSIAAAFSAGPNPWIELEETRILPTHRGLRRNTIPSPVQEKASCYHPDLPKPPALPLLVRTKGVTLAGAVLP